MLSFQSINSPKAKYRIQWPNTIQTLRYVLCWLQQCACIMRVACVKWYDHLPSRDPFVFPNSPARRHCIPRKMGKKTVRNEFLMHDEDGAVHTCTHVSYLTTCSTPTTSNIWSFMTDCHAHVISFPYPIECDRVRLEWWKRWWNDDWVSVISKRASTYCSRKCGTYHRLVHNYIRICTRTRARARMCCVSSDTLYGAWGQSDRTHWWLMAWMR